MPINDSEKGASAADQILRALTILELEAPEARARARELLAEYRQECLGESDMYMGAVFHAIVEWLDSYKE